MSQINPLAHVVFQSIEVHRRNAVEKEHQLRQAETLEEDMAAADDVLEHQVETTEEVQEAGDETQREKQRRKQRGHGHADSDPDENGDGNSHIDVTA